MNRGFSNQDHYLVLGITTNGDFRDIKRAYYARVKECHPDLFGGDRRKEEEFKCLALAFDTLSDPDKRRHYDAERGLLNEAEQPPPRPLGESIMDTVADDILEEIIVDNDPPPDTTIATLLMDLQKTEVFIAFREGKTCFRKRHYRAALPLFRKIVELSPGNILYRVYLARSCALLSTYRDAVRQYRAAIKIGECRHPPQRLEQIRYELERLRQHQHPWWQPLISTFFGEEERYPFIKTEEEMIDETNRAIARLLREREKAPEAEPQKNQLAP